MRNLLCAILLLAISAAAQEVKRPTTDSDNSAPDCFGATIVASASGANAYDASGTSTSVAYSATATNLQSKRIGRLFNSWAGASGSYSALSLNINSSCTDDAVNAGGDCVISYSTDGGTTWTAAKSDSSAGGWTQQTTTVALTASQSLASVQVRACADAIQGQTGVTLPGSGSVTLFDIWTSGTLATPAAPTGLSASSASNGLSVTLNWTDNATNETSYQINKCTGASCTPASYQTGLVANSTSFTDTIGITNSTTYGYQACAVNSTVVSCSATVFVTTPAASAAGRHQPTQSSHVIAP
jgi:hypothetical protein